jgi:hypothetical protein
MDDTFLLNCPPELLDLIFEQLETTALHALCLVSKVVRQRAEPFLYSKIHWTWTFGWPADRSSGPVNQKILPIVPFLRTISRRPELGPLVREVDLKGDSLSRITHFYRGRQPTLPFSEEIDGLIRMVSELGMPEEDETAWIRGLRDGIAEAFVALLLSQAPNLKHLRLEENYLRDPCFVDKLLSWTLSGSGSQKLFQRVSQVHFHLANDMRYRCGSRNLATSLSLFYIPSIEHLSVSIDNIRQPFQWPFGQPPHPSRLTSLDLGMLREGNLGKVLSVIPNLKTLRWGCFHDRRFEDRLMNPFIDLDQIAADLSHVRQSLASLTVTAATEGPGMPWQVVRVKGSLLLLAGFNALTSLELPLPFLVGSLSHHDALAPGPWLPRNLEILAVTDDLFLQDDWEWSADDLWLLFSPWIQNATWKAFTPRLRRLQFRVDELNHETFTSKLAMDLVKLGEQVGLDINVIQGCRHV